MRTFDAEPVERYRAAPAGSNPTSRGRAFTLVELMVVIGIMALVVAIVLPAANSLLASSRASSTLATMHVLENAIDLYVQERPFQDHGHGLRIGREPEPLPKDVPHTYARIFGPYPPTPTVGFAPDLTKPKDYTWPLTGETDIETQIKFLILAEAYMPGRADWDINISSLAYTSIECMLLFLNQFSPEARKIIDGLPDSAKTNSDKAIMWEDIDPDDHIWDRSKERAIDLFEVIDAWKKPIRYSVKEPYYDSNTGKLAFPAVWELRSAGPDGEFSAPWTDEDKSDDVILRSQ